MIQLFCGHYIWLMIPILLDSSSDRLNVRRNKQTNYNMLLSRLWIWIWAQRHITLIAARKCSRETQFRYWDSAQFSPNQMKLYYWNSSFESIHNSFATKLILLHTFACFFFFFAFHCWWAKLDSLTMEIETKIGCTHAF